MVQLERWQMSFEVGNRDANDAESAIAVSGRRTYIRLNR